MPNAFYNVYNVCFIWFPVSITSREIPDDASESQEGSQRIRFNIRLSSVTVVVEQGRQQHP